VGDLFDRGSRPDIIIDMLSQHHAVDIQWGNHDVLWMGAASGSMACIAVVLNNSIKYGNLDCLETAYGINLRPLALFAQENYKFSKRFSLKQPTGSMKSQDTALLSKMYQAVCMIQFKLEGQIIRRHPEYHMADRLLLNKNDYTKGTIQIGDQDYPLDIRDFPAMNPEDPYILTPQEQQVMEQLVLSFRSSYKLQRQIRFLYAAGSIYLLVNNNLLFHGCIPMDEDGTFQPFISQGKSYAGKAFFDYADKMARLGYYAQEDTQEKMDGEDFLWFLWCGRNSPLFGRDRITTFERLFIDDTTAWIEKDNPYYSQIENPEICRKLFDEFNLNWETGHIINGHVPVNVKGGESPIKGGGKIIVIDGGFCRAYQAKTGIAGYTLIYDSHGMRIASHEPFSGTMNAIKKNSDILSQEMVFETPAERLTVADTDSGFEIKARTEELKVLLQAYRLGVIKERNTESD
jgi:fructose-1,6-bisphosphatase-3